MDKDNLKVGIDYYNKNMELVGHDEFKLDLYCHKLSDDIIHMLSDIESFFNTQYIDHNIDDDQFYRLIRHRLFDIAGSIKRIPDDLHYEEIDLKATKKSILDSLFNNKE